MAVRKTWGEALFIVHVESEKPQELAVKGRNRWALESLIDAGETGCSPMTRPTGPRWSAYVYNLRSYGVPIETVTESHGGPFRGTHAKYVLRAKVTLQSVDQQ